MSVLMKAAGPNPYCETLPTQLRAWDATALRRFQMCPRKYQLEQVQGWRLRGGIHLEFGSAYHKYAEAFDRALLDGTSREEATAAVFAQAVQESIGTLETEYLQAWRCTSPAEKIGVRSGRLARNATRCDAAKKPQFEGGHRGGEACPQCGLPTVDDWEMVSLDKNKNRDTLLRTVLYYCDTADERVLPYCFPDGTPAVELSFKIPLPLESPDGTPYLLTGNLDGIVDFAGEVMPRERKTTKNTPGMYFFDKYAPDTQIDTYDLACWLLYSDNLDPKPHGVMVEVTQITPNFTKIERQIVNIPEERRAEHLQELLYWIKRAEDCARAGVYPKNPAACSAYGGCEFRRICRMAPSSREAFLPGESYVNDKWNPLAER